VKAVAHFSIAVDGGIVRTLSKQNAEETANQDDEDYEKGRASGTTGHFYPQSSKPLCFRSITDSRARSRLQRLTKVVQIPVSLRMRAAERKVRKVWLPHDVKTFLEPICEHLHAVQLN
jgi:hypothetical protein